MEDMKLLQKITCCRPIGVWNEGRPKNRWKDGVINDLKKLKWEIGDKSSKIKILEWSVEDQIQFMVAV